MKTLFCLCALLFCNLAFCGGSGISSSSQPIPEDIRQVFDKPAYHTAVWGLRVVDLDTGQFIYDLHSERPFLIGSVRKLFLKRSSTQPSPPSYYAICAS
jgi:D-alanyl-D-alanine carboxypeptidase